MRQVAVEDELPPRLLIAQQRQRSQLADMLGYLLGRQPQPPKAERLGQRAQELGELRQRNVAAGREGQEAEKRGGEGR